MGEVLDLEVRFVFLNRVVFRKDVVLVSFILLEVIRKEGCYLNVISGKVFS